MADFNTYKQRYYVVTAEEETTIVDTETGKTLAVVPAKTQQVIQAIGSKISASADCVVLPFDKALSLNTVGGQTKSKEVLTAAQTYRLDYADGKTLIDLGGSTYNGYLCYNHTGIKDVTVKGTQNSTSMAYAWYGCNQLDRVTFTDTPEAAQSMSNAFNGCTSLTSLDGLPVDEEGYQVIKCSSRPDLIFRSCHNLAGKYKLDIAGSGSSSSDMFRTNANIPTTGDLDLKIVYSGSATSSSGAFCMNNPNLHDVYIEGGNTTLGTSNNLNPGAFDGCKNLNKVHFVYRSGNIVYSYTVYWYGYLLRNTSCREFIGDWSGARFTGNGLLMTNCFSSAKKLRRVKAYSRLSTGDTMKRLIVGAGDNMFNGDANLTQVNLYFIRYSTGSHFTGAFKGCKLDLPSVQVMAESPEVTNMKLTLGISRYKLAYDTSKNDYFEAGEVKYTDDDKIWYLKADGTETTDPNEAALNDYITTDPAEGAYPSGGYYAKGALKEALDTLTGKGYVLTVEYN